jgi:hypothetical protein
MSKLGLILMSTLIAFSMSATMAFAEETTTEATTETTTETTTDGSTDSTTESTTDSSTVEEDSESDGNTSKGKGKGKSAQEGGFVPPGLLKAMENVKGTPAESVISNLLAQYYTEEELVDYISSLSDSLEADVEEEESTEGSEETVTEETATEETEATTTYTKEEIRELAKELKKKLRAEAKDAKEQAKLMSKLADVLNKAGDTDEAIDAQEEAFKNDFKNLEQVKKLGKLKEKAGKKGVKAYVNGAEPEFDVPPIIKDGRTLIPLRAISEALGALVGWDAELQEITITRGDIVIKLILGSAKAHVNGQEITLDVPAESLNGRTLIPGRFVSEALQAIVKWEPETQSVVIYEE